MSDYVYGSWLLNTTLSSDILFTFGSTNQLTWWFNPQINQLMISNNSSNDMLISYSGYADVPGYEGGFKSSDTGKVLTVSPTHYVYFSDELDGKYEKLLTPSVPNSFVRCERVTITEPTHPNNSYVFDFNIEIMGDQTNKTIVLVSGKHVIEGEGSGA